MGMAGRAGKGMAAWLRAAVTSAAIATTMVAMAATAALAAGEVTVEGNRFYRDGAPWVAKGVVLVGMVAPEATLADKPAYASARDRYGPKLLDAIVDYGADAVRIAVSQSGLDPQSPIYDPRYRDEVLDAVAEARAKGLAVLLLMQWQGATGLRGTGMPTDTTHRAWAELLGPLSKDRGVLLEVFNEPTLKEKTPENWAAWQQGMQGLIDQVRASGAKNVILVDGLRAGHYLGGSPPLHDPAGQLGYAVHPFLTAINKTRKQWDENYGDFARDHPVMGTSFNARSANGYCRETFPEEVDKLLKYLNQRHIGLFIWAFDLPGVRRADGRLSTYDDFSCDPKAGGGAGEAVHEYFMAH